MSADTPLPKAKNNLPADAPAPPISVRAYAGAKRRYTPRQWAEKVFGKRKKRGKR